MWVEIMLFLFLVICGVWDAVKKEIPLIVIWIGMATAVVLRAAGVMEEESWVMTAAALLPGVVFWAISYVTREKVGYGDGWVLLMIGLFAGVEKCIAILMTALLTESVCVIFLLALRKVNRDKEISFVPFLLVGLGVIICG